MCTLGAAIGLWPDWPLVLLANRDEQLDRPARPPRAWRDGPVPVYAPEDLRAGGTWLGLNARGLCVGLTNRFGLPPDPARRSRGLLVRALLDAPDAATAAARLATLDPATGNPCHLLLVDRAGAFRALHDGTAIHVEALAAGWHVLTERSLGAGDSARPGRVQARLDALDRRAPPTAADLTAIVADHAEPAFEGACVHVPAWNYGTRSSTLLWLGAAPGALRWLHADGPPCQTAFVDLGADARAALGWRDTTDEGAKKELVARNDSR